MIYLLHFLFPFGALYFGRTFCIDMGCIDIGYCIYDIYGLWTVFMVMYLWLWLCICGFVYGYRVYISGFVFMAMCMTMCLWLLVYGFVWTYFWMYGCVFWLCVYGYGYVFVALCMGIGSRSSARPGSSNIGAYLSLEPEIGRAHV